MRRFVLSLCLCALFSNGFTSAALAAEVTSPVALTSRSAVLMEAGTGRVLLAKDEHVQLPPASVTKLMVMLLVMEAVSVDRIKLADMVGSGPEACKMGGSQIWLEQGEEMSVADLMKAVSIVSANDASVALAEHVAGSEENFVRLMNKRAAALGMKNTNYINCTGLTPDDGSDRRTMTTAYDQAILAREVLKYPYVLRWTGTWIDYLRGGQSFLRNTNNLVRFYDGCDGLKTGFTEEAGFCLVATANRAGVRLIAVTMNAPTAQARQSEIGKMFNYGFSQLKAYQFYKGGEVVAHLPVSLGQRDQVPVAVARELSIVVDRETTQEPAKAFYLPRKVTAPITQGKVLGKIVISLGKKEYARVDLIAAATVPRCGFWKTFGKVFVETFASLFKRG